MKLNFMHILAKLGFDGVYPIYWIKESKHAIGYITTAEWLIAATAFPTYERPSVVGSA